MPVDLVAPNGDRIVLRPAVKLPGLGRGGLAAVVVVCGVFLLTSVYRLNHTDLWGHLDFGRWIVTHGQLPSVDPFRADRVEPFVNVPWLAQVLGYACHQALGLEGLVLAHAGLVALTFFVLILAVRARGVGVGWGAAAAVVAYGLALPIIGTIRPQLFGMLGFALTLYGIALLPTRRSVFLWLPLVFVLWANLHGSFPMGLLALGCYAVGETWSHAHLAGGLARRVLNGECHETHGKRGGQARRLNGNGNENGNGDGGAEEAPRLAVGGAWLAVVVAVLAVCVNPCGVWLFGAVAGFSDNTNLTGISEWRPMVITSLSGALFYGSLVLTAVLLCASRRRLSLTEALLLFAFGLIAFTAIRMLVWWALVLPWIVVPHVAAWVTSVRAGAGRSNSDLGVEGASEADAEHNHKRLLYALIAIGLTIWWAPPTHALCTGHAREAQRILSTDTPHDLAGWMCRQELRGRLFAPMDWADYLIWRTGGAVEPLVHSHVHLVSPAVWQDFLELDRGGPKWSTVAERHDLHYLVVSRARHQRLLDALAGQSRYRLIYEDRQTRVFQRSKGGDSSGDPLSFPPNDDRLVNSL